VARDVRAGTSPTEDEGTAMRKHTYSRPVGGTAVPTFARKRVCAVAGCSTLLSMYNASESCWLHDSSGPRPRMSPTRS
jgi:hypothetical protein